jgi:hypothetical protein
VELTPGVTPCQRTRLAPGAAPRQSPVLRHAIREIGATAYTSPERTLAASTLVRRSLRNRLRLLGVALAGALVGVIVGYLLLTVTILRWSTER